MDKLQERALAFKRLMNYEYIIKLGRKGRLYEFTMMRESRYFDVLGYRFEYFDKLESILDSNNLVFKHNKNEMQIYSRITADYMLQHSAENELIFYLFTEQRNRSESQFCKSFFENHVKDYSRGQTLMTLLYKEKVNIKTNERYIQYDRLKTKKN